MGISSRPTPEDLAHDRQLITQMASGNTAVVADLYERYGQLVFAVILKIVRDPAVAEDLAQDVFVRIWKAAATYQPELGSVRAWIVSIAHHRAVDEWRRLRKENNWISLEDLGPDGATAPEAAQTDPLVHQALKALPPEQCQVVELAYFQGFTMIEIAERLHLPHGTIKSRMRLALSKLRAQLGLSREHTP